MNVITGGAVYAFRPGTLPSIGGLGDGAYWDRGRHTLLVREGQHVVEVVDELPVNVNTVTDLNSAHRQAALTLAAKVIAHW